MNNQHKLLLLLLINLISFQLFAQQEYGVQTCEEPFQWSPSFLSNNNSPFPISSELSGVVFTGRYRNYTNADTWYPTWGEDDNLYSPWTDGYIDNTQIYEPFRKYHPGHACNSVNFMGRKASTAQAKISGDDPMNLTITDLGGSIEASPAPYGGRYPCGSLMYNGIWYYGTYALTNNKTCRCGGVGWTELGPFVGFRTSLDKGKTWTETEHSPAKSIFGENPDSAKVKLGAPHFVDFGKNMEHSPDGKAYMVAHGSTDSSSCNSWIQGDNIYLLRVTPGIKTINNPDSYEFFAGKDENDNSIWTNEFSEIKPLLSWLGHLGCVTVTYNPALKKYLMCITRGVDVSADKDRKGYTSLRFDSMILGADELTGEWKMIQRLDQFGPVAYFLNIPSKFISDDGKKMWLCYSANFHDKNMYPNPPGSYYTLSLHEFELEKTSVTIK